LFHCAEPEGEFIMKLYLVNLFRSRCSRPVARKRSPRSRLLLECLEDRAVPTTFTVNIVGDPVKATTGNMSLREAIAAVNADKSDSASNPDTIAFAIEVNGTPATGLQVIALSRVLPNITRPVDIDGTTEPGYAGTPLIELTRARGKNFGGNGLTLLGGNSTVQGLDVYGFANFGIQVQGTGNTLTADYVGVQADGQTKGGNGQCGIYLYKASNTTITSSTIENNAHRGIRVDDSTGVTIGGTEAADGNTIEANGIGDPLWAGIVVMDHCSQVAIENNTLTGNGRGIRVSGSGATLFSDQSYSILVAGNTIEGNQTQGIWIDNNLGGAAQNVQVSNNTITGNTLQGIKIDHVRNITITANDAINGNGIVKKGNGHDGILITAGCAKLTITSNTIDNNGGYGVDILSSVKAVPDPEANTGDSTSNTIEGNVLGVFNKRTVNG
jgi:parallel beta-helix repeat protein